MEKDVTKCCKTCKRIIIKDWVKYLEDNSDLKYIECPYCGQVEEL